MYRWLGSVSAALLAFLGLLTEQDSAVAIAVSPAPSFVESTDDDDAPTARLAAAGLPAGGAPPPVPPRLLEPLHVPGDPGGTRRALTPVPLAPRPLAAASAAPGAGRGVSSFSPLPILTPLRC